MVKIGVLCSILSFKWILCVSLRAPHDVRSVCYPCQCIPELNPRGLYCQSRAVTYFPNLSDEIKLSLEIISMYDTYITCLPNVTDQSEYPNLLEVYEYSNILLQCECMESWFLNLREGVLITSECPTPIPISSTNSLFSSTLNPSHDYTMSTSALNSPPDYTTNESELTTLPPNNPDSHMSLSILIIAAIGLSVLFILMGTCLVHRLCGVKCTRGRAVGGAVEAPSPSRASRVISCFTQGDKFPTNQYEVGGGDVELWSLDGYIPGETEL